MRLALIATAAVAAARAAPPAAAAALPPVGARVSFFPATAPGVGLRHCDYVCAASQPDGSEDFLFVVAAPLNGDTAPGSLSFKSANFPDHWLSPIAAGRGAVGVNVKPDPNDATWLLTPGPAGTNWTLATQAAAFAGAVLSLGTASTNPCHDGPDIVVAAPGAAGVAAQAWVVGTPPPPPPPPPTPVRVDAATVLSTLPQSILGCHSDEGFMHQPSFFLAQMVYGEAFETTNGMRPGWSTATDGTAQGSAALDPSVRFAAAQRPAMKLAFASGAGSVRLAHRGMGNEGLFLQAGKGYEGYIFARADAATAVTVALRDYTSGAVLASAVVTVPAGGAWTQLAYSLTPAAGTDCEGIAADPEIDCNNANNFADYVCIKCAGELSYGLSAPGAVWIGYARLEPGAWGRWQGLPIRAEAAATLQAMGVGFMRYGGSVGASVAWKDFRGPVWNRTALGRTWASCDLSGWGPFDALDFLETLNVSVAVTLSASQSVADWQDLVEYALGDASTRWGAQRIADGHPGPYTPYAWELGNEQTNADFVAQVAAMEAKAASLGHTPSWFYMYPDNGGLSPSQQAAAVAAGLPIERIATDVHVGSAGGIQQIAQLFAQSPAFPASAINGEVNAIYGDGQDTASAMGRALSEAADINAWLSAPAGVLSRTLARTASFCSERNGHDDGSQWHQGLSFFLPNMTWLGPAGQYHAMLAKTWAPGALAVELDAKAPISASAQKDTAGGRVVVRLANANAAPAVVELSVAGFAAQPLVRVTTLAGTALTQTNTPAQPLAIAPVESTMTLPPGGGNVTLPPFSAVALELLAA